MSTNRSLAAQRWFAQRDIDVAAGEARLRYITDCAGQQAVYIIKLEQARAYLADTNAVAPYITAEAAATGQTSAQVAEMVVALGTAWNEQLGPAIEAARIGSKASVTAAQDAPAIALALAAAIAVLIQI